LPGSSAQSESGNQTQVVGVDEHAATTTNGIRREERRYLWSDPRGIADEAVRSDGLSLLQRLLEGELPRRRSLRRWVSA